MHSNIIFINEQILSYDDYKINLKMNLIRNSCLEKSDHTLIIQPGLQQIQVTLEKEKRKSN